MKGVIDRIEDGKIAVINIVGGGSMQIPAEQLGIEIQGTIAAIEDHEKNEKTVISIE